MNKKEKINYLKNEKGITLIALVVTIIVLIILAGISINLILGENGVITQVSNARVTSDRANVIEAATLAYNLATMEKLGMADDATMADLAVIELRKQGYDVKDVTTTTSTITQINLSSEEVTLEVDGEDGVINITYQTGNSSVVDYYILIGKEYYELTISSRGITLAEEPTDVENLETNVSDEIQITSSDTTSEIIQVATAGNTITITPVTEGTATITVTNGSITKTCEVTVEDNKPSVIEIQGANAVNIRSEITLSVTYNKGTQKDGDIQWTSSNSEVATVDANTGVVTGVNASKGTTTITATYLNDTSVKDEYVITVNPILLGDCSECEEGFIEGYVCQKCGEVQSEEPNFNEGADGCINCR